MTKPLIAVLVALLVLIGLYRYGYSTGWNTRDAEMQAEIAKKNEEARATEQKLTNQINANATQLLEANNALDAKSSALDRAIRAGRVRLPASSCVQASPSPSITTPNRPEERPKSDGQADQATDAERQTLAAIAAIVAEGDRAINQLNACIDAYEAVRSQINGNR